MIFDKFLIVFALTTLSFVIMTDTVYASSEPIRSPRQQLELGILPNEITCREGLTLVMRDNGNVACVSESFAEKFGWRMLHTVQDDVENTAIDPNTSYDEIMKNTISNTPQHSNSAAYTRPTAYANGSFSNGVHVNATFPKSVHVNETFTINYSWSSDGTDIPDDDHYFTPRQMDIGNVNVLTGIDGGQFFGPQDDVITDNCIDYLFEQIKYSSKNILDRSGTMVLKFTDIINSSTPKSIINIFFIDDTYFILTASDGKNGTIILTRTIGSLFLSNPPCLMDDIPSDSNSGENIPLAQQSAITSLFDRPRPIIDSVLLSNGNATNEMNLSENASSIINMVLHELSANTTIMGYNSYPASIGSRSSWPHISIEFPNQVQKGSPFNITVNYTWVEFETDDGTDEIEISTSASENGDNKLDIQHSSIRTDFVTGVTLLNDNGFIVSYSESESLRYGYNNTYKELYSVLTYDESKKHQKILTYKIDKLNNQNHLGISISWHEFRLHLYEDEPGIITLTEGPRSNDESSCDMLCLAYEYNEAKIASEGPPEVYVLTTSGIRKVSPNSQNMPPIISDEILEELKFLDIDKEIYINNNMTVDDLVQIKSMHNNKTYEDITKTAEYIEENQITEVVEYLLDELYTLGFIKEFGNRYPELIKQNIVQSSSFLPSAYASSDTIDVYGKFYVEDMDGGHIATKGVKVCAYEYDEEYNSDYAKFNNQDICTVISRSGQYFLTVPNIDMQISESNPDIIIKFIFESDDKFAIWNYYVRDIIYNDYDSSHKNVADTLISLGTHIPSNYVMVEPKIIRLSKVFNIFTTLDKAWNYFKTNHRETISYVDVEWGSPLPRNTVFNHHENKIILNHAIHPVFLYDGRSLSYVDDAYSSDTVLHEYGHKIQHSVYNLDTNTDLPEGNDCSNHNIHSLSNDECAWAEGYAHFVAAVVNDDPIIELSVYKKPFNIETGKYNTSLTGTNGISFPINVTNSLGTSSEGWISSVLWDIHDDVDEIGDDVNRQKTNLWTVFSDMKESHELIYPASNILDFKDDWDDNEYPSIENVYELNNLMSNQTTFIHDEFTDTFENTFSQWRLVSDSRNNWEIVFGSRTGTSYPNHVAQSLNCDYHCHMTSETIDTSGLAAQLSFWLFVSPKIDDGEGLRVEITTNNGQTWTQIFFSDDSNKDYSVWSKETLNLASYQSDTFKIRFTAISSSSSEIIWIDDVQVSSLSAPPPTDDFRFKDSFENTLSQWTLESDSSRKYWRIESSSRTGAPSSNQVAYSANCDRQCNMTSETIDTTGSATQLSFWRYVSSGIDNGEGLLVQVSTDDGNTWIHTLFFSEDNDKDDSLWHKELLSLEPYQSDTFKIRFTAISSSGSEAIRIDDVIISDLIPPTVEITRPPDRYSTESRIVTVRGTSSGNTDIVSVKIYVNDVLKATITEDLDEWYHNVRLSRSSNTIKAVAEDAIGTTTEDSIYVFHKDDDRDVTGPIIVINSPVNNHVITSGFVTVSGSARDSSGIQNITIIPPTGNPIVFTGTEFNHTFAGLTDGSNTFTINSWDDSTSHNKASKSVTVIVSIPRNTVSSLNITSEKPHQTHAKAGDTLLISLQTGEPILNASIIALNRTITPIISDTVLTANLVVHENDTNGPMKFHATLDTHIGTMYITESNLTSTNIIIDTIKPKILILGSDPDIIPYGTPYTGGEYSVSDPGNSAYNGTAYTNITSDEFTHGNHTILYDADTDAAGNIPDSKIRGLTVFSTESYAISFLNTISNGSNSQYAKAGDGITLTLQTDRFIHDAVIMVENRTLKPALDDRTLTVVFPVNQDHTNGNLTFEIALVDVLSTIYIYEYNITGSNVFIDTIKPNLTLNGAPIIHTEFRHDYIDPGTTLHDNDPVYSGTVISNVTTLNTSALGTYLVEYSAPADFAGNKPENVTRTVIVSDTSAPYLTNLTIYSDNSNTARAKAGDTVQITLVASKTIENTTSVILGRSTDLSISDNIVTATTTVLVEDSGNITFVISASDLSGNKLIVTETDLKSLNIFVDNQMPVLTINGLENIVIVPSSSYTDKGASVSDNDPMYDGTVFSNASLVDTSEYGTYTIEYSAPPDLAGNHPISVFRAVDVGILRLNPIAISTIVDNNDGFTELDTVIDIDTVIIGSKMYAMATAFYDYGVQLMDVTDPTNPTAVSVARQGSEFTELTRPHFVRITTVENDTYAVVTSFHDGVQIINITDPENPSATSSISDGVNGFTAINRPYGLDVVKIESNTYAITAGLGYYDFQTRQRYDSGIQIINITDPQRPTATAAIFENIQSNFTEILGAYDVSTVKIGSYTYAIVAAYDDDGVQIINITDPQRPTATAAISHGQDGFTALNHPNHVDITTIGGDTYAVITTWSSDGTQIINITDPTNPLPISVITKNSDSLPTLRAQDDVEITTIGSKVYALMTSNTYHSIQIADITDPLMPLVVFSVRDGENNFSKLYGARGIDTFKIDSSIYALVAAQHEDSIQVMSLTDITYEDTNPAQTPSNTSAPSQHSIPMPDMPDLITQGLHVYSDNTNVDKAMTGDTITVTWFPSEHLSNISSTILGRTANVTVSNTAITATTTVLIGDSGFTLFTISALDPTGNMVNMTHFDLDSSNVFVDNIAPVLTLHGMENTSIQVGTTYYDDGANVYDNDPSYDGKAIPSTIVDGFVSGVYVIEYTAPADLAGNNPDSIERTVVVHDMKDPVS